MNEKLTAMSPIIWNILGIWLLCVAFKLALHLLPAGGKSSWLVFACRNRLFQALYVALLAAAHAVIAVDILPHLYAVDFDANHTLVPMVLLVANVILFVVCSCRSVSTRDLRIFLSTRLRQL